jgi:two-component system, response regulator PdtaR
VLKILVVEDDTHLATTMKYLVEDNPRYRVVAIAEDVEGAVAAAQAYRPDIALVDLHLARGSTGFSAAVRLGDLDVPCLFVTGKAPAFPMPDLALGCLLKPFTAEEAHRAIGLAEDRLRGREALRSSHPANFTIYEEAPPEATVPHAGFIPSRRSMLTRLEHWIAGRAA